MDQEKRPPLVIVGDNTRITSILLDPFTGMQLALAEPETNPFVQIGDARSRYQCAVRIVEFAQDKSPHPCAAAFIQAAKALLADADGAWVRLQELFELSWNLAATASYLGVKVGSPHAGTIMAAHALGREDPTEVAELALRNTRIMALLLERQEPENPVRRELESLVTQLVAKHLS